jgi:hypothetical protein
MNSHVLANFGPDPEQDTLTFVVARPITVWLAEVAGDNWAVNSGYDFGQRDRVGLTGEHVATPDTTL